MKTTKPQRTISKYVVFNAEAEIREFKTLAEAQACISDALVNAGSLDNNCQFTSDEYFVYEFTRKFEVSISTMPTVILQVK